MRNIITLVVALLLASAVQAVPKTTSSSNFFPLIADQWFAASGLTGGVYGGSASNQVDTQPDHMSGFAAYIPENATQFDEVAIYANNSRSNAEATICIYEMKADGMPGTVADESAPIDISASGKNVQNSANTISLNQGWHIFMFSLNDAFTGTVEIKGSNSGGAILGASAVDASENGSSWYKIANDYSVDPCPDLTSETVLVSNISHCYGTSCVNDSTVMPAFYLQKK